MHRSPDSSLRVPWVALLLVAACSAWCVAAAESARAEWLDVRECGASGSRLETTASTRAGSNQIVVRDVGDFKVGQGVTVSRCNIRIVAPRIWGPEEPYSSQKPLGDALEIRGYDGSTSSWLVFILEIDSSRPLSFRWSDSLVREGRWQGTKVPVTGDWQKLSGGVEVKFNRRDLQPGHMLTFSARDQLSSVIEKIDGHTLTLRDAANRTAADAVVRHDDSLAIQAAVDRAIREKRNVYFPVGWYRVPAGVVVRAAPAICLEGASGVDTVMDISDGAASVFSLHACTEVTIRNFRMIGHTGMAESAGAFRMSHGRASFWACALKPCNAVGITHTERALVENVHASRMASECFYASGTHRRSTGEQRQYQKALTYLRCSVTDCAANAFNNNDVGENTSVLYCRIQNAGPGGWHAAEMPARFLRVVGNYVCNAGPVTVGDMSHRDDDLERLGCGQAVVADNVFEGIGHCGGVRVNHGSSQVVIRNNLFINFNGPAITASSHTVLTSFPSHTVTITGNIIDMTCTGDQPAPRVGITVSASHTLVADNQVYVRGPCDPRVIGIEVSEPALNVTVHDNLIRNCQQGLAARRARSRVREVVDQRTLLDLGLPLEWNRYRGWSLVRLASGVPHDLLTIEAFDPRSLQFTVREPHGMQKGSAFDVFPSSANWNFHSNTITDCRQPLVLDAYGSETSLVRDNLVTRGAATGVKAAVDVRGLFKFHGNQITGFDEPGASAFSLLADPFGRMTRNVYRDNVVRRCTALVPPSQAALWDAAKPEGNAFFQ
jgi:hypothetical protein